MSWRLATSLIKLRDQINNIAPNRDKSNDGTIGDERHQASKSDHNPNKHNVVQAIDITHNPPIFDAYKLAEELRTNKDKRIKYVISNKKIFSSVISPWIWRAYNGTNAHSQHTHISVSDDPNVYDDNTEWSLSKKDDVVDGKLTTPSTLNVDMTDEKTDWNKNITATVFGGTSDPNTSAYDNHPITDTELGVALPYKFSEPTIVDIRKSGSSTVLTVPVVDVGPWNINDPYWLTSSRPQSESGTDTRGRKTNKAGIDLTPALANKLTIPGKGKVDWKFNLPVVIKEPGDLVVVEVKSSWYSKINWVSIVGITSALLLYFTAGKLNIDESTQNFLATSIPVVIGFITITLRNWFTTTVTPDSIQTKV